MSDSSHSSDLWVTPGTKPREDAIHWSPNQTDPWLNTATPHIQIPAAIHLSVTKDTSQPRPRQLVRSLSGPAMTKNSIKLQHSDGHGEGIHSISPAAVPVHNIHQPATRNNTSAVKHLTCFWWREKGGCRFSDDDCLYAHRDTGLYTDPPRQIFPGEPALAGRKLDRAIRNLEFGAQRSSVSLNSFPGSRNTTRPSTPYHTTNHGNAGRNISSPLISTPAFSTHHNSDLDYVRVSNDNDFLRTLVDQNGKEKAILISTIESLQADKKALNNEVEGLRTAQEQLLAEREGLQQHIKQMEDQQAHNLGRATGSNNPFGAIGRSRVNTETRYLGGLLADE